mmetsp:Transcript_13584/g.39607  ORF Transcript_13584/g.39607 Transcript_13584/m.39607 type:complete len:257 (+) Transcript_13584:1255-2025(+)
MTQLAHLVVRHAGLIRAVVDVMGQEGRAAFRVAHDGEIEHPRNVPDHFPLGRHQIRQRGEGRCAVSPQRQIASVVRVVLLTQNVQLGEMAVRTGFGSSPQLEGPFLPAGRLRSRPRRRRRSRSRANASFHGGGVIDSGGIMDGIFRGGDVEGRRLARRREDGRGGAQEGCRRNLRHPCRRQTTVRSSVECRRRRRRCSTHGRGRRLERTRVFLKLTSPRYWVGGARPPWGCAPLCREGISTKQGAVVVVGFFVPAR